MLMFRFPVSRAVHGMRGGAAVNASARLQHQNSGHQVSLHTAHLLLACSRLISCACMRGRVGKSVVSF